MKRQRLPVHLRDCICLIHGEEKKLTKALMAIFVNCGQVVCDLMNQCE